MSADEVSDICWMSGKEILKDKSAPIWLKESIEKAEKIRSEKDDSSKDEPAN